MTPTQFKKLVKNIHQQLGRDDVTVSYWEQFWHHRGLPGNKGEFSKVIYQITLISDWIKQHQDHCIQYESTELTEATDLAISAAKKILELQKV